MAISGVEKLVPTAMFSGIFEAKVSEITVASMVLAKWDCYFVDDKTFLSTAYI